MASRTCTDHDLTAVGLFADLPEQERARLEAELTTVPIRRGEVLIHQGDAADALYFCVSGRFLVTIDGRAIAEIGPGSPIGEIAFLAGGTRTATVSAARDSLTLKLGREQFERLAAQSPVVWRVLTAALARRLADQTAGRSLRADPRPRTITIIPAGAHPVPARFVDMLERVLARHARTCVLSSDRLAGLPIDSAELTRALNAEEARNAFVVYLADAEPTPWSEKAVRQADLVLRVGVSSRSATAADVAENSLERLAASLVAPADQRLVLLHEKRGRAEGTLRWLEPRTVAMHHHVTTDDTDDIERLYRFIIGTALGLVACGGGAFSPAHVGLYKAVREAGIVLDMMGGTSGGSAMTAAFALGHDPDDIDDGTHAMFVAGRAMRRYTWPRYSLIDHTAFDRMLAATYGEARIEDMWIPWFAVSTNLSSYTLHRHARGEVWRAVRASSSIPGLLPPYYTSDGQMLVDGCLLDNVPIRVMRELKRGPNIVVAFEVPQLERFEVDYGTLPGRGDLIRRQLMPFLGAKLPAAPGIGTVLMRSLMANRQDFKRHLQADDLLLVPPLPPDMGLLDWHRHRELVAKVHDWTRTELPRHTADGHPALVFRN